HHHHRPAGLGGGLGRGSSPRRTASGPPDVPGPPDRGEPGDRGARRVPSPGGGPPRTRGAPRGDFLPLHRGPDGEAVHRLSALADAGGEEARPPNRGGAAGEPPGKEREASGGRRGRASGGMTAP